MFPVIMSGMAQMEPSGLTPIQAPFPTPVELLKRRFEFRLLVHR
jgi:hypothetical protein